MSRSWLVITVVLALAAGAAFAAPPGGYSAGPNPIFGSPGALAPSQYSYPAPGTYGSTRFTPNAVPPLSGAVPYVPPLPDEWPAVASARVTVRLPADAKLWVDGKPTKQTGAVREFVTPRVLKAGLTYQYTLRAEWAADGKMIVRDKPVKVRATGASEVDFTKP